jgi:Rrf2 family transcriptional regulator, iron-sulfur cluster assembly transcription factor
MIFSKSFGYAVRGVLYIALMQDEKKFVHVEEIARKLTVPRHFMGKILKRLVKDNVIHSSKGPMGGFTINDRTLSVPLIELIDIIDGMESFKSCVLRLKECNPDNPCPLHGQMVHFQNELKQMLAGTTINDLLKEDKADFVQSLSTLSFNPKPEQIIY